VIQILSEGAAGVEGFSRSGIEASIAQVIRDLGLQTFVSTYSGEMRFTLFPAGSFDCGCASAQD
jgi:hypothetical protein